jgi:carboxyl-terminal processing protease
MNNSYAWKIFLTLGAAFTLYAKNIPTSSALGNHSIFDEEIYGWSRSMAEVFHLVNTKSYFPVSVEQSMIKLLDAFVHQDDYSHFLGPQEYKGLMKVTTGNFFGIGIVLGPKRPEDEFLLVLDVIPGKPADKKGIQRYDKIIAIDGKPVGTITLEKAIDKLKSEKRYSPVKLDIIREKKGAFSVTVERDLIEEEHITAYHLPTQNIFYCALSVFSQQVAQQLETILKKAIEKKPKGIVLDLRDNSGGILQSAVDCAGLFLKKGSLVVSTKDRNHKVLEQYHTARQPLIPQDIIVMVLVNEYTASAAEILAKALQAHAQKNAHPKARTISPNVFLVGVKTYGKGSVQEVIPMSNNCALKITTCLYYLPDDSCINATGIIPDFVVEQKYPPTPEMKLLSKLYGKERNKKGKEEIEEEKSEEPDSKDWKKQRQETFRNDYQIQTALNFISLLDLARTTFPHKVNTRDKAHEWLKNNHTTAQTIDIEEIK